MKKILSISAVVILALIGGFVLQGMSSNNSAAQAKPLEGFKTLEKAVATNVSAGKIEVAEVFWYGCGHCYHLEKQAQKFKKSLPKNVEFIRIPAPLNQFWENHARIYYIADALNVAEKIHPLVFKEIMEKRNYLEDKIKVAEFFAKQGFEKQKILNLYDSFGVNSAIANAKSKVIGYKITSVPQVVVNGKFVVSSETAKGAENIFPTVRKLVEKIQTENDK